MEKGSCVRTRAFRLLTSLLALAAWHGVSAVPSELKTGTFSLPFLLFRRGSTFSTHFESQMAVARRTSLPIVCRTSRNSLRIQTSVTVYRLHNR